MRLSERERDEKVINEKAEGNGKGSACVRDREKEKGREEGIEGRWKQMEEEVCV